MQKEKKYEFWIDSIVKQLIEREEKLKRKIKVFRTESGLGASGFPHIGSFGDVVRNYVIALGLKERGIKAEFIAFSDDRDGLRKVPLTLPDWLEKHIGAPVTDIPDPFGKCHDSFGEHMRSLLLEALDKAGIEYKHHSATEDYKKGVFNEQIETILLNAEKVGKIVKEMLGQEKFVEALPYFPVCEKCGKIYTTRSYELLPKEHKVLYVCDAEFQGKNLNTDEIISVKGCGYKGEASYFNGTGKLSWKVEFAMRWSALQILFEAHGKDILDSVKVNDEIARKVLNFEPPLHVVYEMFLDKSGKKISKSYGNVFTPQAWFNYGSPQSLLLLMLKRFEGTRELDVTDIPKYMDELNKLERIYFGLEKIADKRDSVNLKRLFEFVNLLKPPKKPSLHVAYNTWVEIAKILPEKNVVEFALKKLKEFGYVKKVDERIRKEVEQKISFARKWYEDFEKAGLLEKFEVPADVKPAIQELINLIIREKDGEKIQKEIFFIAKKHGLQPPEFFKIIYKILLQSERGPRLGPYIIERGKGEVIEKLREVL
jgi:lysyl-tRNA synthetase class 1